MLKIFLKALIDPAGSHGPLSVSWDEPTLTVNGTGYDLSLVEDGDKIKHPVLRGVYRNGDDYEVTVRLPHGMNAPASTRFPEPITVIEDGPVELPTYNTPEPEADDELA